MCYTFLFLAGVYDDLQLTQLDVKSWANFLPEQKNLLLVRETKGDEANAKKTEKDEGGPIKLHQAPLLPIFTSLSTSEVGRVRKDDDWLDRNQENFVPFSQKGK